MIDSFDYKEPRCALCDGKDFYNPKQNAPKGRIPVSRIIEKVDNCFNKNDYFEAGRLLEYWKNEAVSLNDTNGELAMQSELIGYYRKTDQKEKAFYSINRALELVKVLSQQDIPSGATVKLNCATAYKAFGEPAKALELYLDAEKTYIRTLNSKDERFGGLYNNMALAQVDLNDFSGALESYNKAILVMQNVQGGQADLAITYVNLAHLYQKINEKQKITDSLFKAYELLNLEQIKKDGYFAYVCSKCAPSFEYFGYTVIAKELTKLSESIYAGN